MDPDPVLVCLSRIGSVSRAPPVKMDKPGAGAALTTRVADPGFEWSDPDSSLNTQIPNSIMPKNIICNFLAKYILIVLQS